MATLRLLAPGPGTGGHSGELFTCTYTPDGAFVLSGGWDGHLRLWETASCSPVTALQVSPKPVSACAAAPDGKQWLAGDLEGLLTFWDPMTQRRTGMMLAHTRPISAIQFAPDGGSLATASWDRTLTLWPYPSREREGRSLNGHTDIVAGCRFSADGRLLLSWSHDGTLGLWEVAWGRRLATLQGHPDRITAAAISPDGTWAVSGSRDGTVKLWNLDGKQEVQSRKLAAEVRVCLFLLDGETVVTVDSQGRVILHAVPALEPVAEVATNLPVQCGDLGPGGIQLVLGCSNGRAHFVAVEGLDAKPLLATATPTSKRKTTVLGRLFGHSRVLHGYACTCPACRLEFEWSGALPKSPAPCPNCRRNLRFSAATRAAAKT